MSDSDTNAIPRPDPDLFRGYLKHYPGLTREDLEAREPAVRADIVNGVWLDTSIAARHGVPVAFVRSIRDAVPLDQIRGTTEAVRRLEWVRGKFEDDGHSAAAIARMSHAELGTGLDAHAIRRLIKKHNFVAPPVRGYERSPQAEAKRQMIIDLLRQAKQGGGGGNLTIKQIAEKVGHSRQYIGQIEAQIFSRGDSILEGRRLLADWRPSKDPSEPDVSWMSPPPPPAPRPPPDVMHINFYLDNRKLHPDAQVSVTLDNALYDRLRTWMARHRQPNRSEALRTLIRDAVVTEDDDVDVSLFEVFDKWCEQRDFGHAEAVILIVEHALKDGG